MERQKPSQRRVPGWAVVPLAAIAVAILVTAHLASRSLLPDAGRAVDPPEATDRIPDASPPPLEYSFTLSGGNRLNEEPLPVSSLVSHGDTLWVGSDLEGLFVLREDALAQVYDGVIYSLLPHLVRVGDEGQSAGEGGVLGGYAYFEGQEPLAEVAGTNGGIARLSRPVYSSEHEEEMGLGLWDGEQWSALWSKEAVWDLVYDGAGRLYLSTNDGVYVYENDASQTGGAAPVQHLGLADTLCFGLWFDDAAQALLVGTRGGIWRYEGATWQKVLDLPGEKALDLVRDETGSLYAATTAGLFASGDGVAWSRVGESISLRTVILAPMGIVAGGSGGVYALTGGTLNKVAEHPQVRALAWHDGRLYAGTNDGLWRLEE